MFEPPSALAEEGGAKPLADRMRPRTLEELVGQRQILAPGKPLRLQIERDQLGSLLLWGPPGVGKTTLARIIAHQTRRRFVPFSAVTSGIKEIREVMAAAERAQRAGQRTILFVDEIHRFNRAQQDAFLPYVESGAITLIGATTENPSFEVNSALLSRARIYVLEALSEADIEELLQRALNDRERGALKDLGEVEPGIEDGVLPRIAVFSNGDARMALNVLEAVVAGAVVAGGGKLVLSMALLDATLQHKALLYDRAGEQHFNLISALHKSLRNSDPDAGLYWLARMLEGGEEPLYIARRLVRFASEDVGMADPRALEQTLAARDAVAFIGMPEGALALAQACVYLALAPKSNALYAAYGRVLEDVTTTRADPVPLPLRNAPTGLMKGLGYGRGYQYAPDLEAGVAAMECLPDNLRGRRYYCPGEAGVEKRLGERMRELEALRRPSSGPVDKA
ncbi:MAG TPA: replication-associated recombination protein A [Terriglobales bacterium]|nr:replication-associated recombination protein A [Terriglobales bacterium]